MSSISSSIKALRGPILVLGAGGFVGANLFRILAQERNDVFAVIQRQPAWRLDGVARERIFEVDFTDASACRNLIQSVRPQTVFDSIAYGAYSFEADPEKIYKTNFNAMVGFVELLSQQSFAAYVHAGSSSEYGANSAQPTENQALYPNSHYAVSKAAAAQYVSYCGKTRGLPCVNLRLYSVYGPLEDSSRLIPNLVDKGLRKKYPPLVDPDVSRDFVYVGDVCEAFILAALKMTPEIFGESFNIGTGKCTTIRDLAAISKKLFSITDEPVFGSMNNRAWDLANWYSNSKMAEEKLGWKARTRIEEGLSLTANWISALGETPLASLTKKGREHRKNSISAIIACYKDEQAIPFMHQRLTKTFQSLQVDYEIIFVNDGSPDNSANCIKEISSKDPHVLGICHSRNFGSQMAFRSGMELASKQSVVLLDGDLQDPPELISDFFVKWREGYDVVFGRRVKREMPFFWGLLYKAFYRVFAAFSYIKIPHDAGDFSLIDRRVVGWLLACPERDLFLRGLRAYVGFKQCGVDYVRPERMFGVTTNSFLKNIGWAKRGIFSFSNTPLNILTATGIVLLGLSILASLVLVFNRIVFPGIAPRGITTTLLAILTFGSLNLFAIGLVGEYIAKIMEEVKSRPRLIRSGLIRNGEVSELLPDGAASK